MILSRTFEQGHLGTIAILVQRLGGDVILTGSEANAVVGKDLHVETLPGNSIRITVVSP